MSFFYRYYKEHPHKKLMWGVLLVFSCLMTLFLLDNFYPLNVNSQYLVNSDNVSRDKNYQRDFAQVVVDENNRPLRTFADSKGIWRYPITLEQVSPLYIEALLNYEDRWFWYHPGINPVAMLRALKLNVLNGRIVSGGSTISMQVARILHPHKRTLWGKSQQILRTLQLEWHLSKKDITRGAFKK